MKSADLRAIVKSGVAPIVRVGPGIADHATCLDPGMAARVIGVRHGSDGIVIFTVDTRGFDAVNRSHESRDYFDKDGTPRLTAREAGYWHDSEDIYVDRDGDFPGEMVSNQSSTLHARFLASRAPDQDYVSWLEAQLLVTGGLR